MSLDTRSKGDKFNRIEGTLEPLWRAGEIIFNIDEVKNPNMERMAEQFVGVDESAKVMDGPDLLEGGVWLLKNRADKREETYVIGQRSSRKY